MTNDDYDDWEDEETYNYYGDTTLNTVYDFTFSASKIAGELIKPLSSSEVNLKFGKIFEECYTKATWLHNKSVYGVRKGNKKFAAAVAAMLRDEDIYSKELVVKAYKMYSCLLKAGVTGQKPKTQFRDYNGVGNEKSIGICAQPDLEDIDQQGIVYYEFKTYPINDYAVLQSKIFSWVIQEKIVLVGLREINGRYQAEIKEIDGRDFVLPKKIIAKLIGTTPVYF